MIWNNLTKNKCPQCNKLFSSFAKNLISCKCGFSISMIKFNKIVNDILNKKQQPEIDNQETLNSF